MCDARMSARSLFVIRIRRISYVFSDPLSNNWVYLFSISLLVHHAIWQHMDMDRLLLQLDVVDEYMVIRRSTSNQDWPVAVLQTSSAVSNRICRWSISVATAAERLFRTNRSVWLMRLEWSIDTVNIACTGDVLAGWGKGPRQEVTSSLYYREQWRNLVVYDGAIGETSCARIPEMYTQSQPREVYKKAMTIPIVSGNVA